MRQQKAPLWLCTVIWHSVQLTIYIKSCGVCYRRPDAWTRSYAAPAVDEAIATLQPRFKDKNLATLWANALPNALDSTVVHDQSGSSEVGPYDTFIVTGDIDAMWQRDSTNQAKPYLRFLGGQKGNDTSLTDFFRGLIARQAHNTLLDPYANSFQNPASNDPGPNAGNDVSTKRTHSTEGYLNAVEAHEAYAGETTDAYVTGIYERKWELDSLANVLHLSSQYFNASAKANNGQADMVPFENPKWLKAVSLIIDTMTVQQLSSAEDAALPDGPAYNFQRKATQPTDTLNHGVGWPAAHTGMIKSAFRGSDDACHYNFNIPENAMAVQALREILPLLDVLEQLSGPSAVNLIRALRAKAERLATEVDAAIRKYGVIQHGGSTILAYEVDGFGNAYVMDVRAQSVAWLNSLFEC